MIKKMIPIMSLSAILGLFALVSVWFSTASSAQTSDERAVRDVLTREAAAIEKGDLAALDKLWANDESVTVFESGHANYGWVDYRNNHLAPELKEFKNTKYAFSDLRIKVDGKTAWATFKYMLATDVVARNVQSAGLGTAVLEKREGAWRIVHWHSSAPRRAAATPTPTPKS